MGANTPSRYSSAWRRSGRQDLYATRSVQAYSEHTEPWSDGIRSECLLIFDERFVTFEDFKELKLLFEEVYHRNSRMVVNKDICIRPIVFRCCFNRFGNVSVGEFQWLVGNTCRRFDRSSFCGRDYSRNTLRVLQLISLHFRNTFAH